MKDLLKVIFEDMNLVWLKTMWDADESIYLELLEIIFMLYLVKYRPQLIRNSWQWYVYISITNILPIYLEIYQCYDAFSFTLVVIIAVLNY